MQRPIIIDTDPGQDDAVAILAALAAPEALDVLAITTVAGNVPLPLTTLNARKLVELAGRADVPIYAGCDRPMLKELVTAEYVHGPTGLDGAELPEPEVQAADGHAVDAIVELVMGGEPDSVTLCTLGPLTNVGMAFERESKLADRLKQVVMMGGGFFEGGNTTPAAEFNVYVDPRAAEIVFTSGVPIVMMPLDVTHKVLTTDERLKAFSNLDTPAGDAVAGMLDFYDRHDIEKYGMPGGPLHDPTVIAYLLRPELFSGKECHVEIVQDGPAEGMTIVDWWGVTGREPNATVMRDIDADDFYDLLTELIGRF